MGKRKRRHLTGSPKNTRQQKTHHTQTQAHTTLKVDHLDHTRSQKAKSATQAQHSTPTIPFSPDDHILLIGEGDLSFARALVRNFGCMHVISTVLEKDRKELEDKYPQVGAIIEDIENGDGKIVFGVDARRMGKWEVKADEGREVRVGRMDKIVFNFPHVGGKSTDVNRQVRYNQELLVSFFKAAMPSLAPGGSIIVTLFEGEPYTLWNIRDLARHSGLQVEKSFKFQASAYPGYHHARTLGIVISKSGEAGAGWKGEDRPARSYVFIRKGEERLAASSKRKRDDDSDDE